MKFVRTLRDDLRAAIDPVYQKGSQIIYRGDQSSAAYGVRVPVVRKIAVKYFPEIKKMTKKELFCLTEELLQADYVEEALVAFTWLNRRKKELEKRDFLVFEGWMKKYINNWPKCDDFCTHLVGFLLEKYPELMEKQFSWTRSKNRWLKRGAAVSLIYPLRRRNILPQVFRVAKALLEDKDDLVQKGYGWMLKVAADHYQKEVFWFVMTHKGVMPRTALRYAIEKMPPGLKKKAMG